MLNILHHTTVKIAFAKQILARVYAQISLLIAIRCV